VRGRGKGKGENSDRLIALKQGKERGREWHTTSIENALTDGAHACHLPPPPFPSLPLPPPPLSTPTATGELLAVKEVDCSRAGEAAITSLEAEIEMLQVCVWGFGRGCACVGVGVGVTEDRT